MGAIWQRIECQVNIFDMKMQRNGWYNASKSCERIAVQQDKHIRHFLGVKADKKPRLGKLAMGGGK